MRDTPEGPASSWYGSSKRRKFTINAFGSSGFTASNAIVGAAGALIKDELARNPTLLGLDRLLEAQLLAAPAERRNDLELVKQLVGQHIKRLGMYKCDHCGFRARQYYWRCPGCGKWETYSPRRTETPDGYI